MLGLKRRRCEKGMTQLELAKAMNVTQGAVWQWESGKTKPTIVNLFKLAKVFECTLDEMLTEFE